MAAQQGSQSSSLDPIAGMLPALALESSSSDLRYTSGLRNLINLKKFQSVLDTWGPREAPALCPRVFDGPHARMGRSSKLAAYILSFCRPSPRLLQDSLRHLLAL